MNDSNLSLWKSVEETDMEHTKPVEFGGRKFTSISGTYLFMRATEIFGPAGEGWGYEIKEERYDDGAPIMFNKVEICKESNHSILIDFWYKGEDGEKRTIPGFGHTPYIFGTSYGAKSDLEAPKKSLTDAIKKCLSMLGFSADIFLGKFDDEVYIEGLAAKQGIEKADDADEERTRQRSEFVEWLQKSIDTYPLFPNIPTLRMNHQDYLNKAGRKCAVLGTDFDPVKQKLVDAYAKRNEELSPKVEMVCPECGTIKECKHGDFCDECDENVEMIKQESK